jgi:hypothetical protein
MHDKEQCPPISLLIHPCVKKPLGLQGALFEKIENVTKKISKKNT